MGIVNTALSAHVCGFHGKWLSAIGRTLKSAKKSALGCILRLDSLRADSLKLNRSKVIP